jgi:hypothetical protein
MKEGPVSLPNLTPDEARIVHGVLVNTWIPSGSDGWIFRDAVRKLETIARSTSTIPPKTKESSWRGRRQP